MNLWNLRRKSVCGQKLDGLSGVYQSFLVVRILVILYKADIFHLILLMLVGKHMVVPSDVMKRLGDKAGWKRNV